MATEDTRKALQDLLAKYDTSQISPDDLIESLGKMVGGSAPKQEDINKAAEELAEEKIRQRDVKARIDKFAAERVTDGKGDDFKRAFKQKTLALRDSDPKRLMETWRYDTPLDALLEEVAKENGLLKEAKPAEPKPKEGEKPKPAEGKEGEKPQPAEAKDGNRSEDAVKEGEEGNKGGGMDNTGTQELTKAQADAYDVLEKKERMLTDEEFASVLEVQQQWDKTQNNPQPVVRDGQYFTEDYIR